MKEIEKIGSRLTEFYRSLREEALILRLTRDPLRPAKNDRGFRANPVVICLAIVVALTVGTFLFFSFGV